jgi:uncharacterized membrane protein
MPFACSSTFLQIENGNQSMRMPPLAIAATALALLSFDAVWLTTMAQPFYRPNLPEMVLDSFRLGPAIAFYLIYLFGIIYFAILPSLASGKVSAALIRGALLGFVCYGTYDLTNQATLKIWPTIVTVVDMAWGTFLTAMVSAFGAWVAYRQLGKRMT